MIHFSLFDIRSQLRLSQKQFAELLEVPHRTYANYESNISEPKLKVIESLIERLKVRTEYIFHGEKPIFAWENDPTIAPPKGFEHLQKPVRFIGDEELFYFPVINADEQNDSFKHFPLNTSLIRPYDPDHVKVFKMIGNSMLPDIKDADYLFYAEGQNESSGLYIVNTRWGITARFLHFSLDGSIHVQALNEQFPEEIISKVGYGFQIMGKIIYHCRRI